MNYIFILIIISAIMYYKLIFSMRDGKISAILDDNIEKFNKPSYAYIQDLDGLKVEVPIYNEMKIASWEKNTLYDILVKEYGKLISISNINTSGSIENLRKLKNGEVDFALCQEDVAYDAFLSRNDFSNTSFPNIRFVVGLVNEYSILITLRTLPIKTFADLGNGYEKINRNYIIGLPDKESGSFYICRKLLEMAHIRTYDFETENNNGANKVYYVNHSINKLVNLFINGKIDAIFLISSIKNPYIINLCKHKLVKFIPVNLPSIDILKSYIYPVYYRFFNPEVFLMNSISISELSTISTISTRCVLLSRKDVNPIHVELLVKTIFQNNEDIKETLNNYLSPPIQHPSRSYIIQESLIPDNMVFVNKEFPMHRGAKKYYTEIGYITEDSNKTCINRAGNSLCNVFKSNFDPIKYYWKYLNLV